MRTCKGKEVRSLDQRSLKYPNNFSVKSPIWSTWMSSSLLANSDTKTFFPSAIRVRDTQSLPEARRWASSGSFSSRESLTVRSRLKVGWKTPRVCFLASFAVVKISAHNCSEGENAAEPNVQADVENQWHYDVSLHYPHVCFFIVQQLFSLQSLHLTLNSVRPMEFALTVVSAVCVSGTYEIHRLVSDTTPCVLRYAWTSWMDRYFKCKWKKDKNFIQKYNALQ